MVACWGWEVGLHCSGVVTEVESFALKLLGRFALILFFDLQHFMEWESSGWQHGIGGRACKSRHADTATRTRHGNMGSIRCSSYELQLHIVTKPKALHTTSLFDIA